MSLGAMIQRGSVPCAAPRYAELRDDQLMEYVARRDERALQAVYDRYHRLVYAIGLRITDSHESAEEVVQDTFQHVWQSASSFRVDASLTAWVVAIARHRAVDHTRSRRFRARLREAQLDDTLSASEAPEQFLALRETLRVALRALPDAQQQAITLAYYAGLSHSEIAAMVGQPVGTIKSRIRFGLGRLRAVLGESG